MNPLDNYNGALASRGSMPKMLVAFTREVGKDKNQIPVIADGPGHLPVPEKAIHLSAYKAKVADLEWRKTDIDAPIAARGARIWAVKARGVSASGSVRTAVVTMFDVEHAARLYGWNSEFNPHVRKVELLESDVVWRPITVKDLPVDVRKLVTA